MELFLPELFSRWQSRSTNHVVSLVLFSRILYDEHEEPNLTHHDALGTDCEGRKCLDVYKVLNDLEVGLNYSAVLQNLREELNTFQKSVLLDFCKRSGGSIAGRLSYAHEGNVLEAVNMAAKSFDKHFIVRFPVFNANGL